MNAAAVQGFYCDLKFIKTRSVAAITIEIPIEQAAAFVAAFGTPHPSAEIPVALARLDTTQPKPKALSAPPQRDSEPSKERRPFASLPASTQAGIVCNEPAFWKYLIDKFGRDVAGAVTAADFVREYCEIDSRSELAANPKAKLRWELLASDYLAWRNVLA